MGILKGVSDFFGGFGGKLIDAAMAYFPPDLDPATKAKIELAFRKADQEISAQGHKHMLEAEEAITKRVEALEGSAADLKGIPLIGPLIIFLRAAFRPAFNYLIAYLFYLWITGDPAMQEMSPIQERAMLFSVIIILVFTYGERAVKHIMPLASTFFGKSFGTSLDKPKDK